MSGPSLKKYDSHHAIHQTAFQDAEELTQLLRLKLQHNEIQQAYTVAGLLVEHWLTRTLQHAMAEEGGWYREIIAESPDLADKVVMLTRDHDLMRMLVDEIQGILAAQGFVSGIVERFEALLLINALHNRGEEQLLLQKKTSDTPLPAASDIFSFDHCGISESRPLSIVFPKFYTMLTENLRKQGVNPADIQAHVMQGIGSLNLHIAYGDHFAQGFDVPLPTQAMAAEIAALTASIASRCERQIKETYYEFMNIPDPAQRRKKDGIILTVHNRSGNV